jgi:ketosteroid isomerase-like protein
METRASDEILIRAVLDRYAAGWRNADAEQLIRTWNKEHAGLYLASEKPAPIHGYAEILQYYKDALALYPITKMEIRDLEIDVFDDLASAFCNIDIGFKVGESEYVVFPRATFLLRRDGGEWGCIQYHESIKYEVPQS